MTLYLSSITTFYTGKKSDPKLRFIHRSTDDRVTAECPAADDHRRPDDQSIDDYRIDLSGDIVVNNLPGCISGQGTQRFKCYNDNQVSCKFATHIPGDHPPITTPIIKRGVIFNLGKNIPQLTFKCSRPTKEEIKKWLGKDAEVQVSPIAIMAPARPARYLNFAF